MSNKHEATAFSQHDVRWSSHVLGNSGYTLAAAGCLISSLASILVDWGQDTDPGRLNEWLRLHKGYTSDGRLIFRSLEPLGVTFVKRIACLSTPAPVEQLERALLSGEGVVVKVDFKPAGVVQQHWVRLLSLTGETCGHIMDPWQFPGREMTCLERYMAPGWSFARGILGAAIYRREQKG